MLDVARYAVYAEKYRWTPEEVDRLPAWVEARLLDVSEVIGRLQKKQIDADIKQAQREAESGRG